MKRILILSFILLISGQQFASSQLLEKMNAGIGFGLDYGGIGAQIAWRPVTKISLFGAWGYNLNSLGYNFGGMLNFRTDKIVGWHLAAMYGYNAVLMVKSTETTETTYYGPSLGTGINLMFKRLPKSFFNIEVLYPFRPDSYKNAINDLELIGYDLKKPLPVSFSFGYHIFLK